MKRLLFLALIAALFLPAVGQDNEYRVHLGDLIKAKAPSYAFNLNQNLRTTDSPTFVGLTLSGGTASTLAYLNASKAFTSLANGAGFLLNDGSGTLSYAAALIPNGTVPLTADWNVGAFSLTIGGLTVDAVAASEATLGSTLLTNGDFATNDLTGWTAAAGWSAATGKAVHTAGIADTTALVQGVSLTNGAVYQVTVTTSSCTAGTLILTFGALTGSYSISINGTYNYTFTATATANVNLTFTPNADFNGAVDDISVKLVTPNATPIINLLDSTSTIVVPVRASAALFNLGIGNGALRYNTVGNYNTGFGPNALQSCTTGSSNSAQGANALYACTTGYYNSAQGANALQACTTGSLNSAQGTNALQACTTGSLNSAQGTYALQACTTGNYNSAQGYRAGMYIASNAVNTTSDYSTYLGTDTKASVDNAQNETVIGYSAIGAGNNTVRLGNTSVTDVSTSGNYISQRIINADSDTDEIDSLTWAGGYGMIIACETSGNTTAIWRLEGTALVTLSVNAAWTATKDNASTYNVYFEGGAIKIQNKVGDNKVLRLGFFGI